MSENPPEHNLEWIHQVRSELYKDVSETFLEKAKRKTKENPLVPIGKNSFHECRRIISVTCNDTFSSNDRLKKFIILIVYCFRYFGNYKCSLLWSL